MGSTNFLNHNDNIAQQLARRGLNRLARLLGFIGKPFYILLITSINTPIIIYYTIRHVVRKLPDMSNSINSFTKNLQRSRSKEKIIDTNSLQRKAKTLNVKKERLHEQIIKNRDRASSIVWLYTARLANKQKAISERIKMFFFDINLANIKKGVGVQPDKKRRVAGLINKTTSGLAYEVKTTLVALGSNLQKSKIFIVSLYKKVVSFTKGLQDTKTKPPKKIDGPKELQTKDVPQTDSLIIKFKKTYSFGFINKLKTSTAGKKLLLENFRNLPKLLKNNKKVVKIKVREALANLSKEVKLNNLKLLILKVKLEITAFVYAASLTIKSDKPRVLPYSALGVLAAIFVTTFMFWFFIIRGLPSPQELTTRDVNVTTKIYDRNGVLLYNIFKDQNRSPVTLVDIPKNVKLATIAIEDAEFYSHPGFSLRGIVRALKRNIERGQLTGGSTITQQLVKNALLSSEKTLVRKIKELTLAVQVEITYNKDQILEMYLNEVAYGGTAYGVQEAANMYFDKDVGDLTLAEAALLAGLPKAPTQFSPFGPNPTMAKVRQRHVLSLMYINGFISNEQKVEAENEELEFAPNKIDIKAPHFVMYVRSLLEEKYGKELVEKGGLEVVTTLDYSVQQIAETVVREEIDRLSRLNVGNGAAIVINPSTGEILAMVGSKNYFDTAADGNVNIPITLQSPGSSIKVINYAYALANGYTPATIIDDSRITYRLPGQPPYTPRNYDNQYRGQISLRSALAESRNIPAVKVLDSYGVTNMIELGQKMGITTWENPNRYGLALTLGGGDIRLIDLAQVYATVANYGKRPEITTIKKVTNYKGSVLEDNQCQPSGSSPLIAMSANIQTDIAASTEAAYSVRKNESTTCDAEQVLDPRVAYLLTDILRDNDARSPAFGRNSQLVIPGHKEIAVKTGTSNDLRDNLTIGYNQNYLVAVWVGNNDNSPMSRIASGITGAAPIFNRIMTALVEKEDNHDWGIPPGLVKIKICSVTGTLPCDGCPSQEEWFLEENQPEFHCSSEFFEDDDDEDDDDRGNRRRRLPFNILDNNGVDDDD